MEITHTSTHREMQDRHADIFELLEQRHPESNDLLCELSNLDAIMGNKAANLGALQQGRIIAAAIRGDIQAWPDCQIEWPSRPEDEDWDDFVEVASRS